MFGRLTASRSTLSGEVKVKMLMRTAKSVVRSVYPLWGLTLLALAAFVGLTACYDDTSQGVVEITATVTPPDPGQGVLVTLSATATDSDGRHTSFGDWTQKSGPSVVLTQSPSGSGVATFESPAAGSDLTFAIRAWETRYPEANAAATVSLTIGEQIVVVVDVSPEAPDQGNVVTLDSSGSIDPRERPLTFGPWIQDDGAAPRVTLTQVSPGVATFVAPEAGSRLTFAEEIWVTADPAEIVVATARVDVGGGPSGPTYDKNIQPIIEAKCNLCHMTQAPLLVTYAQVAAVAADGSLETSISCSTPPGPATCMGQHLTPNQRALMLEWIELGYPEN